MNRWNHRALGLLGAGILSGLLRLSSNWSASQSASVIGHDHPLVRVINSDPQQWVAVTPKGVGRWL